MSTLSSANVTDVNLVLKERAHKIMKYSMLNIPIRVHILGNWPIDLSVVAAVLRVGYCRLNVLVI